MKKLFLGCLLLITACTSASSEQTATPTLTLLSATTETSLPTLIPDTPTPAPTATVAFSPTPFPRYFTNQFDSSLAGWVTLQANNDSSVTIKTENGALLLQLDFPFTWLYTLYGVEKYTDIRIETQFQNRAGTPASVGLICRYGEEQGWFEFNVTTDGTYNILYGKWLTVGIAEYVPVADDASSNLIQPSGATQTIGLTCEGNILTLSINDIVLRRVDVERFGLSEGNVGMAVSSYENVTIVAAFDWVKINEP